MVLLEKVEKARHDPDFKRKKERKVVEMKKFKFYVDEEKLNEYEKENKKISYATLIDYLTDGHIMLCNNIVNVDEMLSVEVGNDYDEELDEYKDIYQYYLIDIPEFNMDFAKKYLQNEVVIYYSEALDLYVLGVDHFGTSWSYVLTDIEYTTEYKGSMQDKLYE